MKAIRAGIAISLLFANAFVACAGGDAGQAEGAATERGGLLGLAPEIELGRSVSGTIRGGQIDVWAIDLHGGDTITLVEKVARGDLRPDASLYLGGTSHVKSKSHSAQTGKLTKEYTLTASGRYYVAVSAYKGQGEGDYTLKLTCAGGPCAGEPVAGELTDSEAEDCLRGARECAFGNMANVDGAENPSVAHELFASCLSETTLENEGLSCQAACDGVERQQICDGIAGLIAFYALRPPACVEELNACIASCSELYEGLDDGQSILDGSENTCLLAGFNGNCDSYARGHADCGGSYANDTPEACHAFCESTFGAWNDDLDTICVEQCD